MVARMPAWIGWILMVMLAGCSSARPPEDFTRSEWCRKQEPIFSGLADGSRRLPEGTTALAVILGRVDHLRYSDSSLPAVERVLAVEVRSLYSHPSTRFIRLFLDLSPELFRGKVLPRSGQWWAFRAHRTPEGRWVAEEAVPAE